MQKNNKTKVIKITKFVGILKFIILKKTKIRIVDLWLSEVRAI